MAGIDVLLMWFGAFGLMYGVDRLFKKWARDKVAKKEAVRHG